MMPASCKLNQSISFTRLIIHKNLKHFFCRFFFYSLIFSIFIGYAQSSFADDKKDNSIFYIIEDKKVFEPTAHTIMYDRDIVVMQGLDKVTARVSEFEVDVGDTYKFGTLLITPHNCRISSPLDLPESASLLEIEDKKLNQMPKMIFSGWMFASSPALNSLEHPVYDVWVVDCKSRDKSLDKQSSSEPE